MLSKLQHVIWAIQALFGQTEQTLVIISADAQTTPRLI